MPAPPRTRQAALAVALLLAVVWSCAAAGPAAAIDLRVDQLSRGDPAPEGFRLPPSEARMIADRLPEVAAERRASESLRVQVQVPRYFGDRRYEVVYIAGSEVRVDAHVAGRSGRVLEVWTGHQANNLLARGYEPSVGRSLNKPYVWLPLALLFLLPFVDPRRPGRLIHLDLLVLLAFGISQIYFNRGQVEVSTPLIYPLLCYLLMRMLLAGMRPRERHERLVPWVPAVWLAVALVGLVGFRIALNAVDSHVIDVGFASVAGADRIDHGEQLYSVAEGADDHGDTYGPFNYVAYLPFEAIFPADGASGAVPAARTAAITFDLIVICGLLLLGARLRGGREGRLLGLSLAYAWAAYPFTLYVLQANTNDGLIAALLVLSLLALRSPPARGAILALAGAAKFAPLALVPLFASGMGEDRRRSWLVVGVMLTAVIGLAVVAYLPDGGLRELYDATIGHQLGRESPFSLWGLHSSLGWARLVVTAGAAGLALAVAFAPARRDHRQLAALAAAVLIAVQLAMTHWFYFYIVWFAPFFLLASLAAYRDPSTRSLPMVSGALSPAGVKRIR